MLYIGRDDVGVRRNGGHEVRSENVQEKSSKGRLDVVTEAETEG